MLQDIMTRESQSSLCFRVVDKMERIRVNESKLGTWQRQWFWTEKHMQRFHYSICVTHPLQVEEEEEWGDGRADKFATEADPSNGQSFGNICDRMSSSRK